MGAAVLVHVARSAAVDWTLLLEERSLKLASFKEDLEEFRNRRHFPSIAAIWRFSNILQRLELKLKHHPAIAGRCNGFSFYFSDLYAYSFWKVCYPVRILKTTFIIRSAVKNLFSTYVWRKVDPCFCEFLYVWSNVDLYLRVSVYLFKIYSLRFEDILFLGTFQYFYHYPAFSVIDESFNCIWKNRGSINVSAITQN